jgi:hypothetical protein
VAFPLHELGQLGAIIVETDVANVASINPIEGLTKFVAAQCLAPVGESVVAATQPDDKFPFGLLIQHKEMAGQFHDGIVGGTSRRREQHALEVVHGQ